MRASEFWRCVHDEFGGQQGPNLVEELVILELGNRTAAQALAAGVPVREVWLALCAASDVPVERHFGRDQTDPR